MGETSGIQRYKRRDIVREQGPRVTYNAIDVNEGTEVLWHEISIQSVPEDAVQELYRAVKTLRAIDHKNIIRVHCAWVEEARKRVVLISEMGSDTLRNYVTTVVTNPSPEMIGNWCSQIIAALEEFHSRGIQHRALTCDHIFFDSAEGTVKVGLPALDVAFYRASLSIEAPEAETVRDVESDIWLFGLCVIELCTGMVPYSEYTTDAEKRKRICDRAMPIALKYVSDPVIADLVVTCLLPIDQRPSAAQLAENDLFASVRGDDGTAYESQEEPQVSPAPEAEAEARQKPEFLALLQRQNAEKQDLLNRQKQARHALRAKIRERKEQNTSLKKLLNEE